MYPASKITAVLGPTNTGKTHLAVERMLASPTGMIGLPLRLLAREIYDKVCARAGQPHVALITGEEKIIPASPRYWVCTVEAMPSDIDVSFVAIDEVQLCGDLDRGHVFTDRVLHRRGRDETMLLGAATMQPMLEALLPRLNFITRPRLSQLTYSGVKKITRLPRRSAVVAFSAETVYALAELIRRQRGGAAVVMGSLSPRTRNAQVALYQSGDVDHLVATDAIGMGLNMDVDHVAFAGTRKFDGFRFRDLTPSELGQIAGRAGRHLNDGTFGLTSNATLFDAELIDRLENHRFEPVRILQWRNRNLNFQSLERLKASLAALPNRTGLTRARPAADVEALEFVSRDEEITRLASSPDMVELLWDVCQIPDYRNITGAEHASLVSRIFRYLASRPHVIPDDWFARQLSHCDVSAGDIDALSNRISHIRTWTFVTNRPGWLKDALHWHDRAREIEDRLSDALHERLTQRFIDRRTSVLMKRLRQKEELMSTVDEDGAISVEGEFIGRITGFRFTPEVSGTKDGKTVRAAAAKVVASELSNRAQSAAAAPDPDFALDAEGNVIWQGAAIASLRPGASVLRPQAELLADDEMEGPLRDAMTQRVGKFVQRHIETTLEPLIKLDEAEDVTGLARGLAFRLIENLGVLPRTAVAHDVKALDQEARGSLRKYGVRFGAFHVFVPTLLKPAPTQLRLLLWSLQRQKENPADTTALPQVPAQGLTSAEHDQSVPDEFYQIAGFGVCGPRIVRVDMLERLADLIRNRVFWRSHSPADTRPEGSVEGGGFTVIPDMMSLVGCSGEQFAGILRALGFRVERRKIEAVEPAPDTNDAAALAATPSETPETVTTDTSADAETVEAGQDKSEASKEEASEPDMLEVWWPRDTGPFRPRSGKPTHEKARQGKPHKKGKFAGRKQGTSEQSRRKPAPRQKKVDKDSPFAVLSALRKDLAKDASD